ncbi:MAG TPA: response regulator [Terriglobales bacterium]|nr:response regulator [Terriglobales bacterium]
MKRIVVADDNDLMRRLLKASLAAGGYEVITVANGQEAIAQMRDQPADLVLMDLHMPELDGLGALRLMRADPSLQTVPVLAITAFFHPEGRNQALAEGFSGYLTKPINRDQLLREVATWIDRAESS